MSSETPPQESIMRGPIPLTLVVACSPSNGIGKNGSLPWRLRKEMAYFKSVTTNTASLNTPQPKAKNVVIMGRNTWESIPKKFRPLPDRHNLVISRTATAETLGIDTSKDSHLSSSLSHAASHLHTMALAGKSANVFLIGGAQLYNLFLQNPRQQEFHLQRLLITRIKQPAFPDCDTFLDEFRSRQQLEADAAGQTATTPLEQCRWKKAAHSELWEFLGPTAPEEVKQNATRKEGDVEYELQMWTALA